ncbi:MAG: DUF2298 domain-containing protein [Clostridiaceae bacterium]|nr:DUF2298 domain-containing protein [Clostridiaceae bacterium]
MKKSAGGILRLNWLFFLGLPVMGSIWLLGADCIDFLIWWLALSAVGWLAWPLAARLFPDGDCGYLLAKPLGLGLSSFLLWTCSYLRLLPFHRWSIIAVLALTGVIAWGFRRNRQAIGNPLETPGFMVRIVAGESLFSIGLLIWSFARGLKPELDSLEKFMDIGFMNSLWRTDYLPAWDMWFSGKTINYYYYGQYVYAFLAKLTGIRPEIAYNLGMASTFAFTLALSYAAGSRLIAFARRHAPQIAAGWQTAGGLLSAFLVTFAGNGHAFLYNESSPGHVLLKFFQSLGLAGGNTDTAYWFADSTRFIGYNPDTADKTIHEFPFYSFLVADLHAHVINLAFVLLLLALLSGLADRSRLLQAAANYCRQIGRQPAFPGKPRLRQAADRLLQFCRPVFSDGCLWLAGLLLAIFMMGNFWDFAIYFAVISLVLFFIDIRGCGSQPIRAVGIPVFALQMAMILVPFLYAGNPAVALILYLAALIISCGLTLTVADALTLTGVQMTWLFFLAHALTLPFNLAFEPISKSIALAVNHTPLWQWLILWGPHILAGVILLVFLLCRGPGQRQPRIFPPPAGERAMVFRNQNRIAFFLKNQNPADLFVLILFVCALGLIIVPECVYVVDIYSGDYKRSNTMFKFTYQAFILFSLVWAYALARIGSHWRDFPARIAALGLALLLIVPFWYPLQAAGQWLGTFSRDRYQGLDGLAPIAQKDSEQIPGESAAELAADYAAIQWFNEKVAGQPVILEAYGDSYTDFCRISAFTGLPTVVGWQTHEWLWRTSKANPNAYGTVVVPRQEDVKTLYTTTDQLVRQALLEQYDIQYIIIGDLERQQFSEVSESGRTSLVQEDLLLQSGSVVFTEGSLLVIKVDLDQ